MLPILDLVIVVASLVLFVCIGYFFRPTKDATSLDYFLAGRKMHALPAGVSISVTVISSFALTLLVGEICKYGYPYYFMAVSTLIAGPISVCYVIPTLYQPCFVSVYQFLETRFSRSVRIMNAVIFISAGVINVSVFGYSAAISAEVLTGIPFWLSALVVGLFSTGYSTLGGVKGVMWTDLVQAFLMILFFLLIITKAFLAFESSDEIWKLISAGGRNRLNFVEGPTHRYSAQSTLAYYSVFLTFLVSVSQPSVQRWKSVSTLREAQWTAVISLVLFGVFSLLVYFTGLMVYAFYARCSTHRQTVDYDKLSLHFVASELSEWPGMIGLSLAAILSSALSSISSFINSFSAVTLEDFIKFRYKSISPTQELFLSKTITAAYGLLLTGSVFVVAQSKSATAVHLTAYSISLSPPLATFFLGLWCKRANAVGVTLGLFLSVALLTWMSVGSYLNPIRHQPLPSFDSVCAKNGTDQNVSSLVQSVLYSDDNEEGHWFGPLYSIAFNWYAPIGFVVCASFGFLLSICYDYFSHFGLRTRIHFDKSKKSPDVIRLQLTDLSEYSEQDSKASLLKPHSETTDVSLPFSENKL